MVKIGKFVTAKYMNAKSAGQYNGRKLVIDTVFPADINESEKLCIRFKDVDAPLALNQTNLTLLSAAWGDESDNWINKVVILHLVNVTYNGQMVLGVQLEPSK